MSNYYYARYQHLSHQQLYDNLRAGDPKTLDQVATRWFTLGATADSLADELERDLTALGSSWAGPAGAEFQRRLGSIVEFSGTLGSEFSGLHTDATFMANRLREAQHKAESPAVTADNDKLASGAAKGAVTGSLFGLPGVILGGIIGAVNGHSQDEAEQDKAHQRMIALVADLAADYAYAGNRMSSEQLQEPPPELPQGTTVSVLDLGGAAGGGLAHPGPGLGHAGPWPTGTVTPAVVAVAGPGTGSPGSGLLGAGSLTGAGQTSGLTVDSGNGVGLTGAGLLGGAGGLAVGGLAASTKGIMSGSVGSGAAGANLTPRAPSGADPVLGREAEERAAIAARNGAFGGRSSAVAGTGRRPGEEEPDERTTWLTEDNMDWGTEDAAPSILGERPPDGGDQETGAHRASRSG